MNGAGATAAAGEGGAGAAGGRGIAAWCLFDWANSAFPTIISTFVFAAYFAKAVAADEIAGTSAWAFTMSAASFAVALFAPVMGAIADRSGRRKPWIFALTLACVAATFGLWFIRPDPAHAAAALVLAGLATFAFEFATVFYNAMLPDLAPAERIGRVSGWGWGLGYCGGLVALVLSLVFLVQPDPPLFGLNKAAAEPVRATALLTALWFALFSIPFFLFTPDTPARGVSAPAAAREGVVMLVSTLKQVRKYAVVARYLLAHMIYADGLTTLFAVGGIYAAVTFGMGFEELLLFGIALNVTAGLGAFAFGWIDDWIGPKATILIALGALAGLGVILLLVEGKTAFWAFALPLGLFLGPAQSASRSLMARLAPAAMRAEMFGLYALSGKATAFLGPAAFGWVTAMAESQRAGMATIVAFLIVGGALLLTVPVPPVRARADRP